MGWHARLQLDYHRDGNTTSHPDSQWVLDDVKVASSRGADGIAEKHTTISYGTNLYDFIQRTDRGYDKVTVTEHYTAWDHQADVNNPVKTDKLRTTVHKYFNGSVWESGLEYETIFRDELVTAIATPWKPDQATLLTIAAGEAAARSEFRWRTRIPEPLPPVETRAAPKSAVVAKETLAAAAVPSAPSWAQPSPALLASVHANVAGAIVVEDFEVTA